MAHSNETQFYHLPLYSGSDIINPLTDFNNANEALDTAMHEVAQAATDATQTAEGAVRDVEAYGERIAQCEADAGDAITVANNVADMMADEFDPLKAGGYAIGDIVRYAGKLYTFINPHTGAWDAGDVKQQPIADAVHDTIEAGKAEIAEETADALAEIAGQTQKVTATQAMIAPPFDAEKDGGYEANEFVTYADKLYMFNDHHDGAWTGVDVTQKTVYEMMIIIMEG